MNGKQLYLTALLAMAAACTKTETVGPPALPATRILEYKITNVPDDPVYGVINDNDRTIKAYVPYYYFLKSLQADIKVADGATVSPASGSLIEHLDSLFFAEPVQYTVTAKDGARASYRLIIDTQQPEVEMDEVSADAGSPVTYIKSDSSVVGGNSFYTLTGKYFLVSLPNNIVPQVVFVSDDGREYPARGTASVNTDDGVSGSFTIIMPYKEEMPDGTYKIKVVNYSKAVVLKNPVRIVAPAS